MVDDVSPPRAIHRPAALLRGRDGGVIPLDLDRWRAEPDAVELSLLTAVPEPL